MKNILNYLSFAMSILLLIFIAKDLYQIIFSFESFIKETKQLSFITTYFLLFVFLLIQAIDASETFFNKNQK